MKLLAVLLVITAVVVADHHEHHEHGEHDEHHEHHNHDYVVKTHDDLLKYREHCVSKLSIPTELVEKYKHWDFPDDEKTHCYMKCIFQEFGVFDDEHGFDVHKIHHQLEGAHTAADHNDETHAKLERCADKNTEGSDACTWAYRGGMCFIRENLQLVKHSVKEE